jgi:ABC-type amino acid transport substrate-binding protein
MILAVINELGASGGIAEVEKSIELVDTLLARYAAVAFLVVVEHGAPNPEPEERRRMQTSLAEYGDRLVIGYAFCGLGFWASAMRTVLVGISRLAGAPVIAHGSVEATAQHIARELIGLDADVMTALCEQLRADLRERSACAS